MKEASKKNPTKFVRTNDAMKDSKETATAYSFRRIATVEQLQLEQTHTVSFTVSLVRLRLKT